MGLSTKLRRDLVAERKRLVSRIQDDTEALSNIDAALGRKPNGGTKRRRPSNRGGAHWDPGTKLGPLSKQLMRALHVHPGSTTQQAGGWIAEHRLPEIKHVPKTKISHRASAVVCQLESRGLVITERSAGKPFTHRLTLSGEKVVESWV
jgi:hypothetical protein